VNKDQLLQVSQVLDYFKIESEKIYNSYNPHIKHFNVNDTVYYIPNYGNVMTAKIESIDDFTKNGTEPSGMIYYWIIPENCKLSIFKKINFWLFLKFPKIKYKIPNCFPGHSVVAGDDIFKTKEEAELYLQINFCYHSLSDYIGV